MSFSELVNNYKNTEENNDAIFKQFTNDTYKIDWLLKHRAYVEQHELGFGDVAFHYMWFLLLEHLQQGAPDKVINLMEIGVFKGQVISLWSLISKKTGLNSSIYAISPFKGKPAPKSKLVYRLLIKLSAKFRKIHESSNFYEDVDYIKIVKNHFEYHELDFSKVNIKKGFSTDLEILKDLNKILFDLIYIDGDHTYETVIKDINNYSLLIRPGGFLVMDDASNNIPGSKFWKGHQQVSDAAEIIPDLGFVNVLNIGHNRIYQKV